MSQIDGPRPSSRAAPSIWYEAVAAPKTKPGGKPGKPVVSGKSVMEAVSRCAVGAGHLTEPPVIPAAMYFWASTSRIAAGTADSTDAAITEPQSPTCAPMYW